MAPTHSFWCMIGSAPWIKTPAGKLGWPILHPILEEFAGALGQCGGSGLPDRHFRRDRSRAVHALEAKKVRALIDD